MPGITYLLMKTDWESFTKRITVNARPGAILDAWLIPSQIERWFLLSAEYFDADENPRPRDAPVSPGDRYVWKWHGFPDGATEKGIVIAAAENDCFEFTFAGGSKVRVNVETESGESIVRLVQSEINEDEDRKIFLGCGEGWTFYLTNLKSIVEGDIDLRNKNERIARVINS